MKSQIPIFKHKVRFGTLNFNHCDLPFDLAQGGELVEPFGVCDLFFGIFIKSSTPVLQHSGTIFSAKPAISDLIPRTRFSIL
jgi:hypothetical protein